MSDSFAGPGPRLILASASPARLATLRRAGLAPEVIVSGVEEAGVEASTPANLAAELARRKGEAVAATVSEPGETLIVACDSVFELDGVAYGKPGDADTAVTRIRSMRGRTGVLHTGHQVILLRAGVASARAAVGSTTVHFGPISDTEVEAYVATGEPLAVAGSFTVDGLGGPFIDRIEGDYHNVVGVSLPLLRRLLAELGVAWPSLWSTRQFGPDERSLKGS